MKENRPLSPQFGVTLVNSYQGYVADGRTIGYNAVYQSATGLGGIAGAWAGAWAGAKYGATIGFAFEGIGVIPGGILGAFFGGIFGGWGGSTITGYGVDQLYQNR